ncbi:hypothetical protein ACFLSI_03700 [Bacteroidota bacterium]
MENSKQHIDNLFNKELKEFRQNPSPHVFDNIKEKLEEKRRKKRLFYIRTITAAAIVVIAFGMGYILNQNKNPELITNDPSKRSTIKNTTENPKDLVVESKQTDNTEKTIENPIRKKNKEISDFIAENISQGIEKVDSKENITQIADSEIILSAVRLIIAQNISTSGLPVSEKAKLDLSSINLNTADLIAFSEKDTKLSVKSNWSIGGHISPSYSYNSSKNGIINTNSFEAFDSRNSTTLQEDPITSISTGIQMSYDLGNKWELASGFYYSVNGTVTRNFFLNNNNIYAINSSSLNNSIGAIQLEEFSVNYLLSKTTEQENSNKSIADGSYDLIQHFEYLEIPLIIKRKIIDKKIGMHILAGFNAGFLIGNNAFYSNSGNTQNIGRTFGIRNMAYNGILGFGLNFSIFSQFSLNFEPSFKYSLRPVNTNFENYYPSSINIFTGIVYNF